MKHTICILLAAISFSCLYSQNLKLSTVVIDAGHGGCDPGAVSKSGKTLEKDINLDVSRRVSELIENGFPDVKVVQTRTTDNFVTLNDRAAIANKASANLFVSVHVNSARSTAANGFSVHILGQSSNKDRDLLSYNMDVCKRENSVILLEDDYTTKYEGFDPSDTESQIFIMLMQNAFLEQSFKFAGIVESKLKCGPIPADRGIWQDPFYVLWKTSMPAVLVEIGFISNDSDLGVLNNPGKRQKIAESIYDAFREYKLSYDGCVVVKAEQKSVETKAPVEEKGAAEPEKKHPEYGIQIFATSRTFKEGAPELLGYSPYIIKAGKIDKYLIAVSDNIDETRSKLEEIRKKYPDCFLVKIEK